MIRIKIFPGGKNSKKILCHVPFGGQKVTCSIFIFALWGKQNFCLPALQPKNIPVKMSPTLSKSDPIPPYSPPPLPKPESGKNFNFIIIPSPLNKCGWAFPVNCSEIIFMMLFETYLVLSVSFLTYSDQTSLKNKRLGRLSIVL